MRAMYNGGWRAVLLGAMLLGGCGKEWLDAKTDTNLAVPSTLADFQSLLDNTDVMNAVSCGIGEIGADGHLVRPPFWRYESDQEYNAYVWRRERPVISSPDWDLSYRRVAYANLVLEGLDKLAPASMGERSWRDALRGGALFQRARSFFELAQVYAPAYTTSLPPGAWGIPLRLRSDVSSMSVRATLQETYTQIVVDLLAAKDLLPLKPAYKTRASRPAVLALLARVYLAMEAYEQAGAWADSCLRLNNSLVDYNLLQVGDDFPLARFNDEVLFHATLVKWGNITVDAMVDSSLYALYDTCDLRRSLFFSAKTGPVLFRGSYNGGTLLFSGLAVDECYLVRAECRARQGNSVLAMQDLNTLLEKRYHRDCFTPLTAGNAAAALDRILLERRKELLLRGLRWTDLRRLNHDNARRITLIRAIDGKTYTLEPDSYRYTFPIPDDIIQASGISQNPGW